MVVLGLRSHQHDQLCYDKAVIAGCEKNLQKLVDSISKVTWVMT